MVPGAGLGGGSEANEALRQAVATTDKAAFREEWYASVIDLLKV
jgi:hypothetical protein